MIVFKKLSEKFPHRVVEWGLSFMLISWGATLLLFPEMFSGAPYYYRGWEPLASQNVWGTGALVVGLVRAGALYVNGAHHNSPAFRTLAGFGSVFIWFFALVAMMQAPVVTTGIPLHFWLMVADGYAIYLAAGDWYQARILKKEKGRSFAQFS